MPVVRRMSYLIPLIPVLWLASSNVIYLVGVQLFSGTLWAGFDICSRSLVYANSSTEKRTGYIACRESLTALGQGLGALAGATVIGFMIPVFGSKILGLFLLSGVARFVVAATMLPNLLREAEETVSESRRLQLSPATPIGEKRYAGSPSGRWLHSQLQGWSPYSKFADSEINPSRGRFTTARPVVYHRSNSCWNDCSNPSLEEDAIAKAYIEAVKSRRGLFFRPWDWADYVRQQDMAKPKIAQKRDSKTIEPQTQRRFASSLRYTSSMAGMRLCPAIVGAGQR